MATTLLLADDSPTIAKILQLALQSEPYQIKAVLTAEDALLELKNNTPYFFLCDLTLPNKNGYEFARLIRADSKLSKVRVVLLSSAFEPVDEVAFQACGADGLIQKPFDPSELRNKLRSIFDTPPKFPAGSKVTGSLSGFLVTRESTNPNLATPAATSGEAEDLSNLLSENSGGRDADAILAGLLVGNAEPSSPEKSQERSEFNDKTFTNATVNLDLSEAEAPSAIQPAALPTADAALDLSSAFASGSGDTAMIDMSLLEAEEFPPTAPAAPDASMSANAQALAAFFSAEIQSHSAQPETPPPAPPKAKAPLTSAEDEFESSLGSIEWNESPAEASLNAWSSTQPKPTAAAPTPAPSKPAAVAARRAPTTAVGAESMMFDTGGSTFRFAEDYVNRITKSFTGAPNEEVPEAAAPVFHQRSDDRSAAKPAATPGVGGFAGGTWSEADVQKIEQIVREEVQMVVREVAEKVAWEVIPELAENLIRKELEKVLKEMELN